MLHCSQKICRFLLRPLRKNFSTSIALPRKKEKEEESKIRIVTPGNCREIKPAIARADCRVAVVIGGANNGYGYFAAEQLLYYGAKRVVLADENAEAGEFASKKLCKAFGKDRAKFYPCDVRNACQIESIFTSSCCRDEQVSILFNDFDAIQSLPKSRLTYCSSSSSSSSSNDDEPKISNVQRITRIGLELMQQKSPCTGESGSPGIILNCATILGFMGWPSEPNPVYCRREPVIETTLDLSRHFPVEETGVRLVAMCPANRTIESIGLPEHPELLSWRDERTCRDLSCAPDPSKDTSRLGTVLDHLLAYAETGSVWLVEAPYTLRELPRLVNIALNPGETVEQPKNSSEEECPVDLYLKAQSTGKCDSKSCNTDRGTCIKT